MRIQTALELCFALAGALGAAVISDALPAAPTAEETVAKARKALGGEKLATLKSLTATGTYRRIPGPGMRVQMGGHGAGPSEAPSVITGEREVSVVLPDSYVKADSMQNGMITLLEGLSEGKGWTDSRSHMGGMVMMRAFGDGSQESIDRGVRGNLARYMLIWTLSAPGVSYTSAGVAEAPDGKADVIEAKGPDGLAARLFLDQETHLPLMMTYRAKVLAGSSQMRMPALGGGHPDPEKLKEQMAKMPPPDMKDVEMQIRISDYEKVSGVQLPKLITWSIDGALSEEFEVTKYVLNPALSPDKFRKGK